MRANLDAALRLIRQHEGGYVDHPRDPGGCTNMGITLATYRAEIDQDATCSSVRNMPWDAAREIYQRSYWGAVNGDGLPPGLDLMLLDFGVNAGPKRAVKTLQRLLGVAVDGIAGPITVAAAWDADIPELLDQYAQARMKHYRSLSIWPTFGRGWTRRTEETRAAAMTAYAEYEEGEEEQADEQVHEDQGEQEQETIGRILVFTRDDEDLLRLPLPLDIDVHLVIEQE